jgi:hypothetical protein
MTVPEETRSSLRNELHGFGGQAAALRDDEIARLSVGERGVIRTSWAADLNVNRVFG